MNEGDNTATVDTGTDTDDTSFVDDVGSDDGGKPAARPAVPAKPGADKNDDLRAAMTELAGTVKTLAQPKSEEKPPTQDEIDEFWAVYRPEKSKPDFFEKMFGLSADMDPKEKAERLAVLRTYFGEMQNGLMKQAVTAARHILAQEMEKVRGEFKPALDVAAQQTAAGRKERFYQKFPALGEKKEDGVARYEKIVSGVAKSLAGKEFASEDEYFKALADGATEAIRDVLPDFDPGVQTTKQKTATTPRLPRTSAGGTGGSGSGAAKQTAGKSDDDSDTLDFMQ